jgi:diketogulonate reductase-like aldo/keto reductase
MATPFNVKGQQGSIPSLGLGTATLFNNICKTTVFEAIKLGYRHIDTALLYDNQEAVGAGIAEAISAGFCTREDLFVTTKVGFYPAAADGANCDVHIACHPENKKGFAETAAAVDLCLSKLGLPYVDLVLVHNPCTTIAEYQASTCPHNFDLSKTRFTRTERELILGGRLAQAHAAWDPDAACAARAATWKALEAAKGAGKARFIGVSNYSPYLLKQMESYATVAPAVNQLELHPRASAPTLRALAAASGMALTAYGTGNSVAIEKSPVVAAVAKKHGTSPVGVVIQWTLARGVTVIPRTATLSHMKENLESAGKQSLLSAEDLAQLDALNDAY